MQFQFFTLNEVIEIHADQIIRYGGADGVRDQTLLLSALAQPSATFDGAHLHQTLFEMAAAYLFHVVKNHPFVDGNKRTGIVLALMFLSMHNIEIEAENNDLEQMVLHVAKGKFDKDQISKWFEQNTSTQVTAR